MSNRGKRSIKDGGTNKSNNELEEMKINKKKHKSIFSKVMGQLQKMFEKKYRTLVEYCCKMKKQDMLDNKDTSCALQAKANKQAKNIPREKDKDTPVKKEFSDDFRIPLPDHWDMQPPDKKVHLVSLSERSPEYQKVLEHFISKGGTFEIISKIERIQNPEWYKAYLVKRQPMNGEANQMKLFHGTHKDNVPFINANNFNRNFVGKHGAMYGNGVYFARDASYSLKYSLEDSTGLSIMYVVNVLVGKFTKGKKGIKSPPSRDAPSNPQLLYDSVVDNVENPSIFVIFADHQCYPEYLITFKQAKK